MTMQSVTMAPPRVGDWPTHTGPLFELNRLGLIDLSVERPRWVRFQRVYLDKGGRTAYSCKPLHLRTEAIRCLAALTFEGYAVEIDNGTPEGFRVRITEHKGETS